MIDSSCQRTAETVVADRRQGLLWDVFCRVIDNFGDIGVCLRLCADLASRGHMVRLWADDPSALHWMAPGALQGKIDRLTVLPWAASHDAAVLAKLAPADVWIEAFGCEIAPEFVANSALLARANLENGHKPPIWINLEYLSAEAFVKRNHGLPSPVLQGPARGWTKHFFYPGFTPGTGGLLREPGLLERQRGFDRVAWLAGLGINAGHAQLVSLFCYEPAALGALLCRLAQGHASTQLLVAFGRASAAAVQAIEHLNTHQPLWNKRSALSISYLPALSQADFDHLLWSCDLNFVRGEDSLVRALWAGKPWIWQLYPQDHDAHLTKLQAFLDVLDAPPSWRDWHMAWNTQTPDVPESLQPEQWLARARAFQQRLQLQADLVSGLLEFVGGQRHGAGGGGKTH